MFKHGDVKFHKELIFNIHECHWFHCNIHKVFFHYLFTCYFIVLFIHLFSHYTMCVHYYLLMCALTFFSLTHFHKYNFAKSKFIFEDHHKLFSTPMITPLALYIKYSQKIVANVCKHKLNLWLASTYFFVSSYDISLVRRRVLLAYTSLVAMGLFIAWNYFFANETHS
jgi:hypothetical protein